MSIYSNVTEQDLHNLRKLAEQQKNQRALKIKNRILKQTHDIKLAESLLPITEKLDEVNKSTQESLTPINEKLDTINKSTQKVGDIIKESNSENEIISSNLLKNTFNSLENTSSSLKLNKDEDDNYSILNSVIKALGGDKILVNGNIYEFNPEIHKSLSRSNYTGKSMKNENDKKTLNNFLTDIGYNGNIDHQTNQTKIFKKLISQYRNIKKEEPTDLKGHRIEKIIIPSNIVDIYKRLEILIGLKLSGNTDSLTGASNLIDELYKLGEIQNKQQYRNALDKFLIN